MPPKHCKILYLVTEDWYFCSHRLPLAMAALQQGYEVAVITRVKEHAGQISQAGIRIIPLNISRHSINPIRELVAILQLYAIYRAERPDIVHQVALKPVLYGSIAARWACVGGVVNAVAGLGWLFTSTSRRARVFRSFVRRSFASLLDRSMVIVQNVEDAEELRRAGVDESRIRLIRGAGVNTGVFVTTPEPEGEVLVLLPARMLWSKGVGEFAAAARELKRKGIGAKFVLAGDLDLENPDSIPERQLRAWQEEGILEWRGHQKNMPELLAEAHIVCLPSYREGLPKALLEAASCGKPIVSTDTPGCREIVRDGVNGLLVPPYDSTALTAALQRLIQNPALRKQMGQRGRERVVEEFSQEAVVSSVLALYQEMLAPADGIGRAEKCQGC